MSEYQSNPSEQVNGKVIAKGVFRLIAVVSLQLSLIVGMVSWSGSKASAQTYNTGPGYDGPTKPRKPRGPNWGGIAIGVGVGLAIINEVGKRNRGKGPKQAAPTKPPKQVKKPSKKSKAKKKQARRKAPKRPRWLALPKVAPLSLPKPRAYSIGNKPTVSETEFVVVLKSGLTQKQVKGFLADHGLEQLALTRVGLLDQIILKLAYPESMTPQQALQMAMDPRIARAQPDYLYYPAVGPNEKANEVAVDDELQYAFSKLGLSGQQVSTTGKGVALAVIDSGVNADHPALVGKVAQRYSAFADLPSEQMNKDHGTAVASIISGGDGMKGVAAGVDLMSAQVFRYGEGGGVRADSFDIVRGIDWAVANGARVLNLSFAGAKDPLLEEALSKAEQKGIVIVAAAGNEGEGAPTAYPAGYASTIAVTATDVEDTLYSFANRGGHVELSAPGVDVLVATGEAGYGLQTGTSMATAYIAGSVALMLEREPTLGVAQVKARLAKSAMDLGVEGRDPDFGHGLANAVKAMAFDGTAPTTSQRTGTSRGDATATQAE